MPRRNSRTAAETASPTTTTASSRECSSASAPSLSSGTYYVRVASLDGEGVYSVLVETVTEPGSSLATALPLRLGDTGGGRIEPANDVDYFRIDVSETTYLFLRALSDAVDIDGAVLERRRQPGRRGGARGDVPLGRSDRFHDQPPPRPGHTLSPRVPLRGRRYRRVCAACGRRRRPCGRGDRLHGAQHQLPRPAVRMPVGPRQHRPTAGVQWAGPSASGKPGRPAISALA